MNKRKSGADDEQAQLCKKLKLKPLDGAADADTLDAGTASSTPSSSAAPRASASVSAFVKTEVSEAHEASHAHGTRGVPASERPNKRKAVDDAESSRPAEPKKKRVEIDWANFDLEEFEARGRGKSPPKYNFQWKEHVYKPRPPLTPFQRAFRNAPREVHQIFAAWPDTDSEDERKRNGMLSPSSSVNGDAVQQPVAVPGAHDLISTPRPTAQQVEAADRNVLNSRDTFGGHASGSGSTQRFNPVSPGEPSASRASSASPPPRWMDASSSRHRLNKGKGPATRSEIGKCGSSHSREKRVPPLERRKKKKSHGQQHPTGQESNPDAKHLEGFLRSTRSSRRGGKCELWCLGDNGVATRTVNKK